MCPLGTHLSPNFSHDVCRPDLWILTLGSGALLLSLLLLLLPGPFLQSPLTTSVAALVFVKPFTTSVAAPVATSVAACACPAVVASRGGLAARRRHRASESDDCATVIPHPGGIEPQPFTASVAACRAATVAFHHLSRSRTSHAQGPCRHCCHRHAATRLSQPHARQRY